MEDITDVVAIDGPAGAGKSTVARRVAEALDFSFLDTGAMYRAATWRALHHGLDMDDPAAVLASTGAMDLQMPEEDGTTRVLVDGEDVTQAIRTPEVTRLIYKIDQNPAVRERLVLLQRQFGAKQPTVAEGRDMGTVVFPKARCKIFLEASLDERTRRRARDLAERGLEVDFEGLRAEIHERDEKTRNRKVAPLRMADDSVLVDTTDMAIDGVVDAIVRLARERFRGA